MMPAVAALTIGQLVRRYRRMAGLTQEELAERAGVSVRTIGDIERGARHDPHKSTIDLLADALGLVARDRAILDRALRRGNGLATGRRAGLIPSHSLAPGASDLESGHSGPVAPPLVGRAQELDLLEHHLGGEAPPVLLFAGEPGIGKSRLLDEAMHHGRVQGCTVLDGACQRGGQDPYAPLLDAVKRYIDRQAPAQLRLELRGCARLVRLLPELAGGPIEPLSDWTLPPEQERRLMFEAVARFLANVAGPDGTLLVLDDLQWAGRDALDLLLALARGAPRVPLRVAGAYRDTEVGPGDALSTALADLAQAGLIVNRALAPLTGQETAQLLDDLLRLQGMDSVTATTREQVLRRAGGVPFFLISSVQALRLDDGRERDSETVTWSVAQSLRQRVAALAPPAQAVIGAAAVIGRQARWPLLVSTVERSEDEVIEALEAAARARLLVEGEGDAYRFAHDVIREVIEADLGPARRTVLHRRVAEALEHEPGEPPLEALAYHYARSDLSEKALLYLERAGDRAEAHTAHAAAEGYYRDLVERLDALGRTRDAARAREKLGTALRLAARYDEALAVLEPAVETYRRAGDLDGIGRVIALVGILHLERGTLREGFERIEALLAVLETTGAERALAALYSRLAFLLFVRGQYGEQLVAAMKGRELARAAGDDTLLGEAEGVRGLALMMLGRLDEGRVALTEGAPLSEAAGMLDILASTLTNIATVYMYQGEFAQARHYAERAIEVVQRVDHPAQAVVVTLRRAFLALFEGDWREARATIEWAVGLQQQMGGGFSVAYPVLALGSLCLLEGKWEEGVRYLERSTEIARQSDDIEALRWANRGLAEHNIMTGHARQARDDLLPLLDRPELTRQGLEEVDVSILLPRLAWAYLELGEADRAAGVADQSVERARRHKHRIALADALWAQGMVTARQERWEEATRALDEGLDLARRMPYRYAEGRILHAYGELHVARGEREPAQERLEEALAIFRHLGARKDVERVERAIADLGPQ